MSSSPWNARQRVAMRNLGCRPPQSPISKYGTRKTSQWAHSLRVKARAARLRRLLERPLRPRTPRWHEHGDGQASGEPRTASPAARGQGPYAGRHRRYRSALLGDQAQAGRDPAAVHLAVDVQGVQVRHPGDVVADQAGLGAPDLCIVWCSALRVRDQIVGFESGLEDRLPSFALRKNLRISPLALE